MADADERVAGGDCVTRRISVETVMAEYTFRGWHRANRDAPSQKLVVTAMTASAQATNSKTSAMMKLQHERPAMLLAMR